MKTLIIVTHPHIEDSLINKRWIEELEKYPEQYTIHQLYKVYPDEHIDVRKEQQLMEQYDHIVFQFPLYWFSMPPLLKKWQDEVFTYGWAYGSKSGYKVGGKKVTHNEKYKYTLKELLRPFELTFEYIHADFRPFFAYYGIELNSTTEWIERSVPLYRQFLEDFSK